MTDEVTPTREQCIEFLKDKCGVYQHTSDGRWYAAVLSHLRTPRAEAETCITCGKPREVSPNFCSNAFHLPRVEAGDERPCTCHPDDNPPVPCARRYALTECRLAALSRRPSEAGDGARGEAKCGFCNDRKVIGVPGKPCPACAHVIDAPSRRLTGAEREACRAGANALLLRCQQTIVDGARGEAGGTVTPLPQGVRRVDAQRLREILSGYAEFDAPTLFEIQSLAYEVRNSRAAPSRRLTGADIHALDELIEFVNRYCEPSSGRDLHMAKARQAIQKLRALASRAVDSGGGRWVPWKPGDEMPARGAYLVCTKYNTGRPRDPIARMETSRHTDDAAAWNDYTVAYWSIPLPPPYVPPAPSEREVCATCGGQHPAGCCAQDGHG